MEGGQVGVYFEAAAGIVTLVLLGQVWSSARAVKPVRRFVHSWVLLPKPPPGLRDDGDMKTRSMLVELDVNNPKDHDGRHGDSRTAAPPGAPDARHLSRPSPEMRHFLHQRVRPTPA